MEEFTEEEKRLLAPFVSNLDKQVFVLTGLPEVVKGALFSRYSRSAKSLRRVLLDEFMLGTELNLKCLVRPDAGAGSGAAPGQEGIIQTKKAEEFYDRVLVGYGDDSVAELAGAHIAIEDISIIATKFLEDARIGLSPLEKSTRYVYFDQKRQDGNWAYLREKTLMGSPLRETYIESCDLCFGTYAGLIPKISKWVMEREPMDPKTTTERAYKASVRAKTCDILRGLLPASTLTNMGFFGDGRAYEYLMTKMYADELSEMRGIAGMMGQELGKVIPSFVKRADNEQGRAMQSYYRNTAKGMETLAKKLSGGKGEKPGAGTETKRGKTHAKPRPDDGYVELVEYDPDAVEKALAAALYPYLRMPYSEIKEMVRKMGDGEREELIAAYVGQRANRRQKPGRGFEHPRYVFDVCANYGAYRDLHRHRILTQQRQPLSARLGYKLPPEIREAGYEKEFCGAMEAAASAYEIIATKHPAEAQYAVPLAYNIRWHMSLNLREAYHMLELRSAMQGHVDYRRVAQGMFREIRKAHPALGKGMTFMDMKEYGLGRLESEKRIDKKMDELAKKYGKG